MTKRRLLTTLLIYQVHQNAAFTSPRYEGKKRFHFERLHARTPDESFANRKIDDADSKSPSRRQFLEAAVSMTALLPLASNAEDLSNLLIGQGSWVDSSDAQSSSSISVPATFVTYLTRFLIQYDPSAAEWWKETTDSYSLLKEDERLKRERRDFGMMACSVERGLLSFLGGSGATLGDLNRVRQQYLSLFESLDKIYGHKGGAIRHIQLLFAMLPGNYQPIDKLRTRSGDYVDAQKQTYYVNEGNSTEIMGLLPSNYQVVYNQISNSFSIQPFLELYEVQEGEITSTVFGPLNSHPLSRQRPDLGRKYYTQLGISGGVGCALTHSLVIPLDVVKTRMQTNPGEYDGVFSGAVTISQKEGLSSLLLGTQATIAGYLWYGISVYPSYTFFKNSMTSILPSAFGVVHVNDIALIAGAIASIIASLGLTPIEAARIRAVAEPEIYKPLGLLGTLGLISKEDDKVGWKNLYAGLPSLMTRQVIFGSVKFLAFERVSETIFLVWPALRDGTMSSLGVSLVAGGMAGALSSIVSQPADSVLTYVTKQSTGNLGVLDGARMMIQNDGIGSLFRGLGSRCVWAGCIIAGQFLLYDLFRGMFGITGDDLSQVFEIVVLPTTQ